MAKQAEKARPETRTDRRRVRTRSALIGAGQRLFADRHIDGVTIDDIVEAADVAKGSFYNHFEDKESLADTIVELVQGDSERQVYAANLNIADADIRMARALVSLVAYAREHPDRYRAMVNLDKRRANMDAPINLGLRHDLEAGLASGQFSDITVQGGMLTVFGQISTLIEFLSSSQSSGKANTVAGEMAFVLLRALGVPGEKARIIADAAVRDLLGKSERWAA